MAAKKVLTLKIDLTTAGIAKAQKELERLNASMGKVKTQSKGVSKRVNELKRNLEGVSQRAGATGKDFSRMAQGMGGLVAAYATVAANVFALSSAFLVLRRAADLSSMIKSAEDFSNRFGVSVTEITKQMQAASGGALDFAEALPTINKAVSAGIGIDQMEKLTEAATKAAQTFGGSTTEALNRFISASQRGRVEIIQTLGVVIKTEQAYEDYAVSIGKTALELTAFDRQQAILNATIAESAKVFAGVKIDPNPFQQLLVTVTDLKDVIITLVTDGVTPLLKTFNQSKAAAAALIAVIASSVGKRIFPELATGISKLAKAGLESTRAARLAAAGAARAAAIAEKEAAKTGTNTSIRAIRERDAIFRASLGKRIKLHKTFTQEIFTQEGKLRKDILTMQRAFLQQELNARAKGKDFKFKVFQGSSTVEVKRQLTNLTQVGARIKDANVQTVKATTAMKQLSTTTQVGMKKASAAVAKFKANIIGARSAIKTGFAQGFVVAEGKILKSIGGISNAWKILIRDIRRGSVTSGSQLANFGRLFGRVTGFIGGGISKLISFATSITLAVSLAALAWELFGKKLFGVNETTERAREAVESLSDSLDDITKRTRNYISSNKDAASSSLSFISSLEFLRGTLDSTLNAFKSFDEEFTSVFNGKNLTGAIDNIRTLTKEISTFTGVAENLANLSIGQLEIQARLGLAGVPGVQAELKQTASQITANKNAAKGLNKELVRINITLIDVAEKLGPSLIKNFLALNNLLNSKGVGGVQADAINSLRVGLSKLGEDAEVFVKAIKLNDAAGFAAALENLKGNAEATGVVIKALTGTVEKNGRVFLNALNQQISATRALGDADNSLNNFIQGIDKLKSASVPNKEIVNFLLNTTTALKTLIDTSSVLDNIGEITDDIIKGEDLKALKEFLNIDDKTTVAEAFEAANLKLDIFKGLVIQNTIETNKLKIATTQLRSIKEEEATTDARRLELLKETKKINISSAIARKNITKNNITLLKAELLLIKDETEAESERVKEIGRILVVLDAELKARNRSIVVAKQNQDFQREEAKIVDETLKSLKTINGIWSRIVGIRKKISVSNTKDLAARKRLFSLRVQSFELERRILDQQILTFDINKNTAEQNLKTLATLEAQLELIEAQEEAFRRTALILQARDLDQTGGTFSKEGMRVLGQVFSRTIRDGVRDLKPVLVTLGEGFANAVTSTFDAAVDKLFEGHGFSGFRDAVAEAFKEGLREAFSTSIKDRIRDAFAALKIFEEKPRELTEAEKEAKAAREAMIQSVKDAIAAQIDNTKAVKDLTAQMAGSGTLGNAAKDALDVGTFDDGFKVLSEKGTDTIVAIFDVVKATDRASTEAKNGIVTLFGALQALLSAIFTGGSGGGGGFVEGVGAIFKTIFAGQGGIIQGGMSSVPRLATGGITNGAQLAVIGEGNTREAVVPLPNNREIPVDLKGGEGDTININQSFDFRNADANSISQLKTQAKLIEDKTFNRVFSEINKGGRYAKIVGRR